MQFRSQAHMRQIFHPFWFSSSRLGPLERRMLDELWTRGSATVRELTNKEGEDLAYTTLMTTLDRLFKKGLLTRSEEGRAFRYAPRLSREEFHREAASHFLRQLLDTSPPASLPLSFLVEILSERDEQLLNELDELVRRKRRELSEKNKSKGQARPRETS
jgi:BlaI family transcriptional regulator, penicillinase repressor